MTSVRPAVAAGTFYPGTRDALLNLVDELLAGAAPPVLHGRVRALVAPHAGYAYSGATAAAAFAALPPATERILLLGPSHYAPLASVAVTGSEAWRTPLGDVAVPPELAAAAIEAGAHVDDAPHAQDHALEVELPFLQRRAGAGVRVLEVAVGGDASGLLAVLGDEPLVVVSTDLSHYHDDTTVRQLDRRTAEAVLALDAAAIGAFDACGADALRSLLLHAREHGWACTLLDLRTSADATGDTQRVVGYGAFAFTEPAH